MDWKVLNGDCHQLLDKIVDQSVQTVITSPPYWQLRQYDCLNEVGQEDLNDYVHLLGNIFDKVKRCLCNDGTLWLNLGDTFAGGGGYSPNSPSNVKGSKQSTNRNTIDKSRPIPKGYRRKDLLGVPWLVAFELQRRGWYLRCDIIWEKMDAMPDPAKDRPGRSHEYIFLFAKRPKYQFFRDALKEKGLEDDMRYGRSVWHIYKSQYNGIQQSAFPEELVRRCVEASTCVNQTVMDPFTGSGTTGVVCKQLGRNFIGMESNAEYARAAQDRINKLMLKSFDGTSILLNREEDAIVDK